MAKHQWIHEWTNFRVKNILEQLSRTRFFPAFKISRPFPHLFSTEKRAGNFKTRKKSWSWNIFLYFFPSNLSLFLGESFLQEPFAQCIDFDSSDIHLQMQTWRRFVALELHTKNYHLIKLTLVTRNRSFLILIRYLIIMI